MLNKLNFTISSINTYNDKYVFIVNSNLLLKNNKDKTTCSVFKLIVDEINETDSLNENNISMKMIDIVTDKNILLDIEFFKYNDLIYEFNESFVFAYYINELVLDYIKRMRLPRSLFKSISSSSLTVYNLKKVNNEFEVISYRFDEKITYAKKHIVNNKIIYTFKNIYKEFEIEYINIYEDIDSNLTFLIDLFYDLCNKIIIYKNI